MLQQILANLRNRLAGKEVRPPIRHDKKGGRFSKWYVLILAAIAIIVIIFNYINQPLVSACANLPDFMSCGEKDREFYISQGSSPSEKTSGRQKFADHNYQDAISDLENAWKKEKDPSTLIALNNARVMHDIQQGKIDRDKVFAIGISNSFNYYPQSVSGAMLTGVAWRQQEINATKKNNFQLIIVMGNDRNDQKQAQAVAKEFGKRAQIIGVIGPYSSHLTYYVMDEYRNQKLVLISATSTATIESFKTQGIKDTSWFFRPISTTKIGAKKLIKYLECKGYTKMKIFYQDDDLFGQSFYRDFKEELKTKKSKLKTISKDFKYKDSNSSGISDAIKTLEMDADTSDKKALVILASADRKLTDVKLNIIKENKGKFFIAGNNTLIDEEMVTHPDGIRKEYWEKIVITKPWFPSNQNLVQFSNFIDNGKSNNSSTSWTVDNPKLTWHMAMSYDAMEMFAVAISQQLSIDKKHSREGIQAILSHSNAEEISRILGNKTPTDKERQAIDILAKSTFSAQGLTGEIKLKGSDRSEQIYSLISPDCSELICKWRIVEMPSQCN